VLHGVCLKVKPAGKPDAVAPHVRFDERGWETGLWLPRPSSTLLKDINRKNVELLYQSWVLIAKSGWPIIAEARSSTTVK